MYVIVVGGGKVGYYLTRTLVAEGHEVTLVEKDARRAAALRTELGEVITRGDGCEVRTMQEMGMERADCVVAVTGDDEDNLVVCQMAKHRFEVARTIARVNDPKNEEIFALLGVDHTLSGTRLIYSLIQQEVDVGEMVLLSALKAGKIEIVSAELTEEAPVVGKILQDIRLPKSSVIAALIREESVLLPSGTMEFMEGDTVIALAHPEDEPTLRTCLLGGVTKSPITTATEEERKK
ncbi:MAG: TrkA family potassium uptake protein [Armatimonadetes bacterium]|nr:TrkA family potassium uptake protein [Armatimonadota bacterium]NIM24796.1 TrkA family potassium uptake protein [Armatimonadota bacterium]NIM68687.1 TrkA family potassium uptake protein [Armatimonadota bacterium]NIM76982.1 TrkA family potassium uptake protein [Armatimonadota bacterium]NIN06888.1 TrkA family potassium uptake protein [Armatimonadota bacterium]